MNGRFQHGPRRRVGSGQPCGGYYGIRLTRAKHVLAKRNCVHGNGSHGPCVSGIEGQTETAPIMKGLVKTGSRFLFRLWLAKRLSLWRKNSCKRTSIIRRGARSSQHCFKESSFANSAATRCTAHQQKRRKESSTITDALAPMDIGGLKDPHVFIGRSRQNNLV